MNSARHLIVSIILAFLILVFGTIGYMLIEGWGFLDALYMTVITISTVGSNEVRPVDAIGRVLTRNLTRKIKEIVVIEKDPALVPVMDGDNVLYLSGDAAEENVLIKAGIERAKGLVAVLATDTDNVFLVLTARQLNPVVSIFARAGREESKAKFTMAGATIVESPHEMGALGMA